MEVAVLLTMVSLLASNNALTFVLLMEKYSLITQFIASRAKQSLIKIVFFQIFLISRADYPILRLNNFICNHQNLLYPLHDSLSLQSNTSAIFNYAVHYRSINFTAEGSR